jgi:hypothetical protein
VKRIFLWMIWLGISSATLSAQTQQLIIQWDPNSENDVVRYRVQRSVDNGSFTTLSEINHPGTEYIDTNIQSGKLYSYRIAAIDTGNLQSNWSTIVSTGIPMVALTLNSIPNNRDTTFALNQIVVDPDHSAGQITLEVTQSQHVSVVVSGSDLTITPEAGYTGPASFHLTATDPDGFWDEKTLQFNIAEGAVATQLTVTIPDIRIMEDQTFTIAMDTCVTVNNFTPDQVIWQFNGGNNLQLQYAAASRQLVIVPDADWNGQTGFSATATVPDNTTAGDSSVVTVVPVNDPPVVTLSQLNLSNDPSQNIIDLKQYASDVDNNVAELSWVFLNFTQFSFQWIDPQNDIVQIISPSTGGTESGTVRVSDPAGAEVNVPVILSASAPGGSSVVVNIPPISFAEDDSFVIKLDDYVTVSNGTPADLLWSFSGGSNLRYTFRAVDRTLKIVSQSPNWFGQDVFMAVASAPDNTTGSDQVEVAITAVNDPPELYLTQLSIVDPAAALFDMKLYADDVDDAVRTLQWQFSGFTKFQFTWENENERLLRIIPLQSNAIETGQFIVTDPHGSSRSGDVKLVYSGTNQPPRLLFPAQLSVAEDSSIMLDLRQLVQDDDNDFQELQWEFSASAELILQYQQSGGLLNIQPIPDWSGQAVLNVKVTDPFDESDQANVSVTVRGKNNIINFSYQEIPPATLRLKFTSELPSRTELRYWRQGESENELSVNELLIQHQFDLTDLAPQQQYYLKITLRDSDNNPFVYFDSVRTDNFHTTENRNSKELIVYPNPVKTAKGHQVMIFRNLPEAVRKIEIYSVAGEKVYETDVQEAYRGDVRIDMQATVSQIPSGIYVYLIKDDRFRVIKQDRIVVIR